MSEDTTATDLVPRSQALPEVRRLINKLAIEAETNDGGAVTLDIMERLMNAATEEELFAAQEAGTVSGKDFVNKPFWLREEDIQWKKSASQFRDQGAFPFYAIMRIRQMEKPEEEIPVVCGAPMVLAVLSRLSELNGFDGYENGRGLMLVSKPAGNGDLLLLKPVASRPVGETKNGNAKNKG